MTTDTTKLVSSLNMVGAFGTTNAALADLCRTAGAEIARLQAQVDALRKSDGLLRRELEAVLEWANTEKAALRPQEIASIREALARAALAAAGR